MIDGFTPEHSFEAPHVPEVLIEDTPTISVDRALGHLFDGFELNTDVLREFYSVLPHEEKPPLSELTIHFSAAPFLSDTGSSEIVWAEGDTLWDGTKKSKPSSTPELPKTTNPTIVVYVGSILKSLEKHEDMSLEDEISMTVTHELTHYAQGRPTDVVDKRTFAGKVESLKLKAHAACLTPIVDRQWAKTGLATFIASELMGNDVSESLKLAGITGSIILAAGTGRRRREHMRYLQNYYLEESLNEDDAFDSEVALAGLVNTTQKDEAGISINAIVFPEQRNLRISQLGSRIIHKELAKTAPGEVKTKKLGVKLKPA